MVSVFSLIALILLVFMAPARGFERVSIISVVVSVIFAVSAYTSWALRDRGFGVPEEGPTKPPHRLVVVTLIVFLTLIHL